MTSNEEPTPVWPTPEQVDAVKIVDALYTFMARTEIYSTEAQVLALKQIKENVPMDKIEEHFNNAAIVYLVSLIEEYGDD